MARNTHPGPGSVRAKRALRSQSAKGEGVSMKGGGGRRAPARQALAEENDRLYTLLELSTLLSSTRGVDQLLKFLAMETSVLLGAERTSIFIYDESREELWSKVAEGTGRKMLRVPSDRGIAGLALRKGKLVNVPDVHRHPDFNPDVDKQTGYHTRNILAAPMRSHGGGVTGVMQVLNKKSGAFRPQDEKMLMSIASIASVALENSLLIESQINLFESFIESSIHALGERDRITYGHTVRVALYSDRIARAISASGRAPFKRIHYSEESLRKLRFAALLHDICKITVPEAILNKRDKLEPHEIEAIRLRFGQIKLAEKIRALENGGLNPESYRSFCAGLDSDLDRIRRNITPGAVSAEDKGAFERMRRSVYRIADDPTPQLTETEYQHLVLAKGNLSDEEFKVMKDHVRKTWDILAKIHWPKDLKEIPVWAATHHERPNGTGYPQGLKGDEIPLEGQILAVADIYDALTAADRPYKKRIPEPEAQKILRDTAAAGHLNADLVTLFLEACVAPDGDELPPAGVGNSER